MVVQVSTESSGSSGVFSTSHSPNAPRKSLVIEHNEQETTPDWFWTYQEEPHRSRRKAILKTHPEITKLCGHEPLTKWVVLGVITVQLTCAYLLRHTYPLSWGFILVAYVIGATCNQNIFLAIHELSHNLGFKKPLHNKLFSILTNVPIGVPYSASFQPYHQLHHKFQGDETYDTDLPTRLEAIVLSNVLGKTFFCTFQLLFYAIRPMCLTQVKFTKFHLMNVVFQLCFDYLVVKFFGWYSMFYLLMSSFLAGSLHPLAGHFIAEHYNLQPPEHYDMTQDIPPPETFSYYGIFNILVYNVGLHNEHHDFPFIPWTRLHQVYKTAPEFYEPLPKYTSWTKVIWDFITDDRVDLWCRVKRPTIKKAVRENVVLDRNEDGMEVEELKTD